jgi:hypothetical protein
MARYRDKVRLLKTAETCRRSANVSHGKEGTYKDAIRSSRNEEGILSYKAETFW